MVVDDTVTVEEELVDLRRAKLSQKAERERIKREKVEAKERQSWYSGMLWIGKQKGFKDGWANHRFREQFGQWPDRLKVIARKPTPEILEAERKRYAEYMKVKRAQETQPEYQGEF